MSSTSSGEGRRQFTFLERSAGSALPTWKWEYALPGDNAEHSSTAQHSDPERVVEGWRRRRRRRRCPRESVHADIKRCEGRCSSIHCGWNRFSWLPLGLCPKEFIFLGQSYCGANAPRQLHSAQPRRACPELLLGSRADSKRGRFRFRFISSKKCPPLN